VQNEAIDYQEKQGIWSICHFLTSKEKRQSRKCCNFATIRSSKNDKRYLRVYNGKKIVIPSKKQRLGGCSVIGMTMVD